MDDLKALIANQELDTERIASDIEAESDDMPECPVCGETADPPYVVVLPYPRPWRENGRIQCHECWAGEAAENTDLTENQARIVALRIAGFGNNRIGRGIGRASGTVSSTMTRLRAKRDSVEDRIDELELTKIVLDSAFGVE